jgi:hypothetical protein
MTGMFSIMQLVASYKLTDVMDVQALRRTGKCCSGRFEYVLGRQFRV